MQKLENLIAMQQMEDIMSLSAGGSAQKNQVQAQASPQYVLYNNNKMSQMDHVKAQLNDYKF